MASSRVDDIQTNGWAAVPVDASKIFKDKPYINKPAPLFVKEIEFPSHDPVVVSINDYAQAKLPKPTYNHSLRVFYFASAIVQQQFPEHAKHFSPSTLALTCLLHDLGTSVENLSATHMSFEFYGAIKALQVLRDAGSTQDQAESVCEAIIRHQDLGTEGNITFLGQVIQLATIYDNVGNHPNVENFGDIIHAETRDDVNKEFPRLEWLSCFAHTIREEEGLKPWCHTTHIPNFAEQVESNPLMKPYE